MLHPRYTQQGAALESHNMQRITLRRAEKMFSTCLGKKARTSLKSSIHAVLRNGNAHEYYLPLNYG
jgi:hypothetical protein